jgi:hypothetical protein
MEESWSVKWLVQEIVLSRTYRQSSARTHHADPDNVWLSRMTPRFIEAEALRDAVLAVSGQLDPYPPQKPFLDRYHPQRDAELFTFKPFMTTADIVDDHRSVYLPVVRGTLPEIFTLFNFAPPERPVAQREESTLPAQALHLMNSSKLQEMLTSAKGRATRLAKSTLNAQQIAEELYLACYSRLPDAEESAIAGKALDVGVQHRQAAIEDVLWSLLNSAEFVFNH